MIIQPITLDLHEPNQIIDPNMVSMEQIPCINISVSAKNVCSWITSKGGIVGITIPGIFELVDAYIGIGDVGFIPTITEILGVIDYYLGFIGSGNTKTGCDH